MQDQLLTLATNFALGGLTGRVYAPNSIDLGQLLSQAGAGPDIGIGMHQMHMLFTLNTFITGATSLALEVSVGTGVSGTGVLNAGQVQIGTIPLPSGALSWVPTTIPTQGRNFVLPIPAQMVNVLNGLELRTGGLRYLSASFNIGGTVGTGSVSASIVEDPPNQWRGYQRGTEFLV